MTSRMRTIILRIFFSGMLLLVQTAVMAQDYDTTAAPLDTVTVTPSYDDEEADGQEAEQVPPPDTAVFRRVPDTTIDNLQRSKDFVYANDPAYWVRQTPPEESESWLDRLLRQKWFKYLILSLMAAVLLYAIIKIAISNKLVLFRAPPTKTGVEEEQELLKREDLGQLISQAEQAGNYRLAVRYRYMKTLQDMEQRKLIQLSARATNWEYVDRLGSHPLRKQFQLLTRAYEYVWYGEFNVNSEQYNYLRTEFQKFENSL